MAQFRRPIRVPPQISMNNFPSIGYWENRRYIRQLFFSPESALSLDLCCCLVRTAEVFLLLFHGIRSGLKALFDVLLSVLLSLEPQLLRLTFAPNVTLYFLFSKFWLQTDAGLSLHGGPFR